RSWGRAPNRHADRSAPVRLRMESSSPESGRARRDPRTGRIPLQRRPGLLMPVDQEETTVRSDGAPTRGSRGPVVALKWVAAAAILLVALVAAGVIVLSALFASGELSDRITS